MSWTIAIAGRPNVGKSTLFNRLTGRRAALVASEPGLTRDIREGECRIGGHLCRLLDGAGLEEAPPKDLTARMTEKTCASIIDADLCLFLVDGRAGLTGADTHWASFLRRRGKPVLLAVNKCEGRAAEAGWAEAQRLGFDDAVAISAEHGLGIGDLLAILEARLPSAQAQAEAKISSEAEESEDSPLRVAIVGRPNTGKSTLANKILGEERMLTGPEQGLTRDAIEMRWTRADGSFLLVDTAGLRKKARVSGMSESLAVSATLRAARLADIVLLTMDATQLFERQDLRIAQTIARAGKMPIFLINKADLAPRLSLRAMRARADHLLPQLKGAEIVICSALKEEGLDAIPEACLEAKRLWETKITTGRLNRWLESSLRAKPPPLAKGRAVRLKYMTQTGNCPPSFTIFTNRRQALPESYRRYLTNSLREKFGLWGAPLRLRIEAGRNPYV